MRGESAEPDTPATLAPVAHGFPRVREHAQICARLSRALQRHKLHHALLFTGPPGVGKATTARGLGCALHCRERPSLGCGECRVCRRVLAGTHAGVEWITPDTPAGSISVESVRALCTRAEAAPFEGDAHLVVIDPGEGLGVRGSNALLKTLEEPQPGVVFVLVVQDAQRLLPTIISRCLPIRFGRLTDESVQAIVEEQALEVDPARQATAVRLAHGQAGLALQLAADESLDASLEFLRAAVWAGEAGPAALFRGEDTDLWRAFRAASEGPKSQKAALERAAVARMVDLWLLHLRERLRQRSGLAGLGPDEWSDAQRVQACHVLDELQRGLDRNANVRLAIEHALLAMPTSARGGSSTKARPSQR